GGADVIEKLAHEPERRLGQRVASVQNRVNRDAFDALSLRQIDHRKGVLVDCVHSPGADQSHQMESPAVASHLPACTHQSGVGVETAIGNGGGDAHQILHHHTARAEIEMSDFAVPHLPFRQTDTQSGCFEQGTGAATPERVPGWSPGEGDRVAFGFGAVAPSIEYYERDWPRPR